MAGKYDNCFLTYNGKQEFPLGSIIQRFSSATVPMSSFYFLQARRHSNTWRADLLPKEERDKIDWSMWEGGKRF
jgi:hypothetical protein